MYSTYIIENQGDVKMTVETTTRKATFAGGQTNLAFSFRTLVDHPEYIKVTETLISSGVETELTYGVDYTVTVSTTGIGGTVRVSPSYSTLYTQTVYRDTTDTQSSDYDDFNQFPADTLEDDLDRRVLISQERSEEVDRTAKLPITSTISSVVLPNPVDGKALTWSGTGGTIVNSDVTSTYVTSAHTIILKVLDDSDSLNTGDGQIYFTVPSAINGLNLTEAHAHVYTASSSGTVTIQLRNVTDAVDMLSTRITIDATETDSSTAATPPVINTAANDIATADVIAVDVDVAGTNTLGLEVRLKFA